MNHKLPGTYMLRELQDVTVPPPHQLATANRRLAAAGAEPGGSGAALALSPGTALVATALPP
ncbi:hypothetical protein [Aeromonas veronii]|uniref:hypothetical protein n=1 Tax=Aeromonas veronii TaxID=654 RepID=UPI003004DE76